MYKAIIFDFFDVIHSDPYRRWRNKYDIEHAGEVERINRMLDSGEITEQEFWHGLADATSQSYDQVAAVFEDKNLIDPDVVSFIKELGSKYKIGLLSNAGSEYLRELLHIHDLAELFDEIVVSGEVKMIKPDPEIFEHILQKLGVKAEESIFIDDNRRNVNSAERLGIKSIMFTSSDQLKRELHEIIGE